MTRAIAAALLLHGALLAWLAHRESGEPARASAPLPEPPAAAHEPAQAWSVALLDVPQSPPGPAPEAAPGTHDQTGVSETHPLPDAERDLPGHRPAHAGGGAPGGPDSWTGRRDRENFETRIWDNPHQHRLARQPRGQHAPRTPASPESLVRQPERGFADRSESRRRSRTGADSAAPGGARADSPGGPAAAAARDWHDTDPLFDAPPGSRVPARLRGAISPPQTALVDTGDPATEAPRRGPVSEPGAVAAASAQRHPAPIEMTAPRAGGTDHGVAGPRQRPGPAPRDARHAPGSAATTAPARRDAHPADLSVRARRHHPYFRRMYQRVDQLVAFPRELALSLRQGQVVVRFTLSARGRVADITVAKSSGHAAFDRQVVRALRRAAPFGRVPEAVLAGRPAITVVVPYGFRNSLIR